MFGARHSQLPKILAEAFPDVRASSLLIWDVSVLSPGRKPVTMGRGDPRRPSFGARHPLSSEVRDEAEVRGEALPVAQGSGRDIP